MEGHYWLEKRLIHAYFDFEVDRLRDAGSDDLPALRAELKKTVPPEKA
ncbi:MAG: hypothetical protein V1800_06915 [Candidatus Latescibacterota bacterium]